MVLTVAILAFMTWGFIAFNNYIRDMCRPKLDKPIQIEQTIKFKPYNVPLSAELQEYTYNLCEEKNVPYALVLAVIEQESQYNPNTISNTSDYGLMGINKINHARLKAELGITDFLEPQQNITAGVHMLSELLDKYGDEHKALSTYNLGERGARQILSRGGTSRYSREVTKIKENIKG